jgi:hypothetical protein
MRFFEVFQDGPDRSFRVYHPANPVASNRFLVVGSPFEVNTPGNTLLTTSKIVDARGGSFDSGKAQRGPNEPEKDSRGNRVYSD